MFDTADTFGLTALHLSHDLPCQRCGHAPHTFLTCDDGCDCRPIDVPVNQVLLSA